MDGYKYKIVLPPPSLYAQVNNIDDVDLVLSALMKMGFDDVYEVSAAAELISELTRQYIEEHKEIRPIISTACPAIVRLIRVRFPNLLENLLPLESPMNFAATLAKDRAVKKTGLPREEIGAFFITPCPAKVTNAKEPFGIKKSEVDGLFAMKEVYPLLIAKMKELAAENKSVDDLAISGKIGISWGSTGGEASGLLTENYLAADGMENVIRVLEDLEDEKLEKLEFIELNACSGGCVGGVLTVENPYVAKVKLAHLRKYMPVSRSRVGSDTQDASWKKRVEYEPVFKLGKTVQESIANIKKVDKLEAKFPGLDCGSCGAPTCRALCEDIVRGVASEKDCIIVLKDYIHKIAGEISELE
jgi:iron only hydrogenase large subunit-like protein